MPRERSGNHLPTSAVNNSLRIRAFLHIRDAPSSHRRWRRTARAGARRAVCPRAGSRCAAGRTAPQMSVAAGKTEKVDKARATVRGIAAQLFQPHESAAAPAAARRATSRMTRLISAQCQADAFELAEAAKGCAAGIVRARAAATSISSPAAARICARDRRHSAADRHGRAVVVAFVAELVEIGAGDFAPVAHEMDELRVREKLGQLGDQPGRLFEESPQCARALRRRPRHRFARETRAPPRASPSP